MKKVQRHPQRLKHVGMRLRPVRKKIGCGLFVFRVKIVPVGEAMRILSGCPPFSDYPAQDRFLSLAMPTFFYQLSGGNSRKTWDLLKWWTPCTSLFSYTLFILLPVLIRPVYMGHSYRTCITFLPVKYRYVGMHLTPVATIYCGHSLHR